MISGLFLERLLLLIFIILVLRSFLSYELRFIFNNVAVLVWSVSICNSKQLFVDAFVETHQLREGNTVHGGVR